ncbi:hypothetical protein D9M71_462980 [compost metagenome]
MIGGPPAWATKLVKPASEENSVPVPLAGGAPGVACAGWIRLASTKATAMPPISRPMTRSLSMPKVSEPISTPISAPGSMIFRLATSHLP